MPASGSNVHCNVRARPTPHATPPDPGARLELPMRTDSSPGRPRIALPLKLGATPRAHRASACDLTQEQPPGAERTGGFYDVQEAYTEIRRLSCRLDTA